MTSFSLSDKNNNMIYPKSIQIPQDIPNPDDMTRWLFMFSHEQFKSGFEYTLGLTQNTLFDKDKHSVLLLESHTYSMRSEECNGHGVKDKVTNQCDCNVGYKPPSCTECVAGYVFDLFDECKPQNSCKLDSCGCLPKNESQTCTPKGICTPLEKAQINCACLYPNYTGNLCDKCAEGYLNYPECVKAKYCEKPCVHGECNSLTGICDCEINWALPYCDSCSPEWSGSNCTTKIVTEPEPNSPAIFIVLGLILVSIIVVIIIFLFKRGTISCPNIKTSEDEKYINIPLSSNQDDNKIQFEDSDDLSIDVASSSMEEKQNSKGSGEDDEEASEEKKSEDEQKEQKLIDI